ncbi:carboxypeptidase regulatory-like domain-containing protein [Kocuria sp. M4R2S49]|uniref:carboxypeptidase regulatory-like domain-containing protein n=1 Tax=Kocuria rhizosphaericola TaxID=3376284 RepID=UPI00379095CF
MIDKVGGGKIASGDEVAIKSLSGFYFREDPRSLNIEADSRSPFQVDTTFVIEFLEARPGLGVRISDLRCRDCATVTGTIRDATGQPLYGAHVQASGVLENHLFDAVTAADGTYTLRDAVGRTCVPSGNITVQASAARHQIRNVPVPVPVEGGVVADLLLPWTEVAGNVVDDLARPVPGAEVVITGSDGTQNRVTTAPEGTFTVPRIAHGAGAAWTLGMVSPMDISVPPEGIHIVLKTPRVTTIELILDWGVQPYDLDAHMSGPDNAGGRFHVHWQNMKPVTHAELDTDIFNKVGKERVTIRRTAEETFAVGEYRYWIYNFSRSSFTDSNAVVIVRVNEVQVRRYVVAEATGNPDEDIWRVVDVTVDATGNLQMLDRQTVEAGDENTIY